MKFNRPSWDEYLMALAYVVATRSHDKRTKHGAILCDKLHRIIGIGYNGFPRGCDDTSLPCSGEDKYDAIIHAEENCLLNSINSLGKDKYIMYITGFPCPGCFNKMLQFGVEEFVYGNTKSKCVRTKHVEYVQKIAVHKNITIRYYDGGLSLLKSI